MIHPQGFLPAPKQTEIQVIKITVIILSNIRICYLLCQFFPSHYMLSFDILFFSFLLPATTVIFISGQQRTANDDANSTYLTVLLFSRILTKRHKTLLQITRLSMHMKIGHFKSYTWKGTMDSQHGSCPHTSNCTILHCSKDSIRHSTIIKQQQLLRTFPN